MTTFPDLQRKKLEEHKWLHQFVSDVAQGLESISHKREKYRTTTTTDTRYKVNTLDMQVHTMRLNKKVVKELNPTQTPVDVSDCPVFDLTKEAQYRLAGVPKLFPDVWWLTH